MESFLPLGGFQLPFQRRLSRLYSDTKKSSDFVKDPVQNEEDPEIKTLHRKLRIQKDRLVSWGLEWSDPNQSAEIDESLSNAGLSEVVGSIMSTIKDILAEAEPLWLSSKHLAEGGRPSAPDRKSPLVQWDRGRFEDLVRDLTSSIDTLYDLSRTRSSAAAPLLSAKAAFKSPASADDFRPFESTRMQTPQHIDPQSLTHLRSIHGETGAVVREVVFMSKTAYYELARGTTRQPWAPLLLEYATFDSIFSMTGIMPPMARFERLSAGLQQEPQRSPGTWTGLPRLLGYFEDMENSRLGLVYLFPPSFNPISLESSSQNNPLYNLPSLRDLLCRPDSEPTLEAKFRLAHNFANTVFDLHARGITHGNIVDHNLSFCGAATDEGGASASQLDVRRPILSSFDLFPEDVVGPVANLSRHPLDPRCTPASPLSKGVDERVLELYSVAMVLLSIGLWTRLEDMIPNTSLTSIPESMLEKLAVRCGSLYMKAVQACWYAVEDELTGRASGEALLSAVQVRASRFLEACCILDGVSGLEQRLGQEVHDATSSRPQQAPLSPVPESFKDVKDVKSRPVASGDSKTPLVPPQSTPQKDIETFDTADVETEDPLEAPVFKAETKVRLYPHVPLAPEVVDKWNAVIMPQINAALRSFYRKHPESVEISLESVGPSPQKTKPTVLVVCTSVGKVRAILKKRLGDLFDGYTGLALKVCRGHVLRSHKQPDIVKKSMARPASDSRDKVDGNDDDDQVEAVNPKYQERPGNGASIGAWVGDRHLPPVSFGGLVMVDNKPYGMTVHHMLDDPDRDFGQEEAMRSSGVPGREWYNELSADSSAEDDFSYELSDTESEVYSDTDITSQYGDDEDEDEDYGDEYSEPGDIPGIEPGCGEGYIVTQPALDDVEEGFFPSAETEDEDHLDSFSLGEVYASSGIRRKRANGLVHEVDWALFEFADERLPDDNLMHRTRASSPRASPSLGNSDPVRPIAVAPSSGLPGMEVQCVARTSGVQTGQILPALTSVKIYGRTSPSHTYQVASTPSLSEELPGQRPTAPMGVPGDSGAWVVDCRHGQLCGHVLAWSQRKHVAYICPMDVLLLDIAQTLEAYEVKLPGGEAIVTRGDPSDYKSLHESHTGATDDVLQLQRGEAGEMASPLRVKDLQLAEDEPETVEQAIRSQRVGSHSSSSRTPLQTSGDLSTMKNRIYDMSGRVGAGIGVTG